MSASFHLSRGMFRGYFKFIFLSSLLAFTFSYAQFAYAATYYVDAVSGSDSNSATSTDAAWKTIAKVTSTTFVAGDTILFKRGQTFTGNLTFSNETGTVDARITVGAYDTGDNPILDASNSGRALFISNSASYMTFENLTLKNAQTDMVFIYTGTFDELIFDNLTLASSTTGSSINTNATTTNMTLRDIDIQQVTGHGISHGNFSIGDSFENISITGGTGGIHYITGGASTSTDLFLDDIAVASTSGRAIQFRRLSDSVISNVSISNAQTGIYVDLGLENVSFEDIQVSSSTQYGLSLVPTGNISIENATTTGSMLQGVNVIGAGDVEINNLYSGYNPGTSGLFWSGSTPSTTLTIDDSLIEYNGTSTSFSSGLTLTGSGTVTVTDTVSRYNTNDGYGISGTVKAIFNRTTADTNGVDGTGSDGDGYSWHGNTTGTLMNSRAVNNKKGGVVNVENSNVDIYNNVFTHDTTGTASMVTMLGTTTSHIYNNTFYNPSQEGTAIGIGNSATADNTVVENNIIHGFNIGIHEATLGAFTAIHNLVYNTATNASIGFTPDTNSLTSDPLFTNLGTSNFTLQESSPAINAGVTISGRTTDMLGNSIVGAPDIGAYEYQPEEEEEEDQETSSSRSGSGISLAQRVRNAIESEKLDELRTLVGQLMESMRTSKPTLSAASGYTFLRNLALRDTDTDVRELQKYLNTNGFALIEGGPGSLNNETDYFGTLTYNALIGFQNAHAKEILEPLGLTEGTGYFGNSTRAFINSQ